MLQTLVLKWNIGFVSFYMYLANTSYISSMARPSTHVVGLLFAVAVLLVGEANGNQNSATPMCSEVRGFASEHNDHFRIGVSVTPSENEAIVLIVRAFPLNIGDLVQRWVQLNATYRLREGTTVSTSSNNDGIVIIPNVEAGTEINVEVKRVRNDGPVPFRFWSYHANRPTCHIDVSASTSFLAPIPTRFPAAAGSARVYFKSVAPTDAKGLMVLFRTNTFATSAVSFQVMSSPDVQFGETHNSEVVFPWSQGVVYFMFDPSTSMHSPLMVQVSVLWTDNVNENSAAPTTGPPGEHTSSFTSNPTVLPSSNESGKKELGHQNKGHSALGFIVLLIFVFIIYMVVMSAVNYRLKGMVEFPEMIPHNSFFRSGLQYFSLVKSSFRQGNVRGGYQDLNRQEMSTDSF
ncbi:hypothetical protein DQ04_01351140 [Trypanosoma grayi]|uniref:hypothetical protein n=1 Tax=Trypanosoma grayi TaxID=71804 RepID=UPI0004F40C16|nr:hypothetical protein DQ04_01351140 [Trypanosoma grayi]KEG12891.1 hypothetical protein DQ04_01351140 [Trypanosoma grayi]